MTAHEPIDAVVAIIRDRFRFLFVRRAPTIPAAGYWCPVSGRIEPGETQPEALRRESLEEVGLDVAVLRKLDEIPSPDGRYRLHYWLVEASGEGMAHIASDEATHLGWFTLAELRRLHPTFPEDIEMVERAGDPSAIV